MGNCLIIHRTCENDSPFLLFCSSYKERAKKTARLAESKLDKKTFEKYTSLNNQDLPIYNTWEKYTANDGLVILNTLRNKLPTPTVKRIS